MSATLESLKAKIELDDSPFHKGVNSAMNSIEKLNQNFVKTFNTINSLSRNMVNAFSVSFNKISEIARATFEKISIALKTLVSTAKQVLTGVVEYAKVAFQSVERVGKSLATVGAVGTVAFGYAIKKAADAESAFKRMQIATNGNTSALNVLIAEQEKLTRTGLFNKTDVNNALSKAYAMGKNYQLTAEQISNIVEIASNLGNIYGYELPDATERLMAAMRGEAEASEALGLSLSQTAVKNWMLVKGIQGNIETMDLASQAQVRYNMLLDTTKDYMGASAKASETLNGVWTQLKTAVSSLVTTVGEQFIDEMKTASKALLAFVQLAGQSDHFKNLVKSIAGLMLSFTMLGVTLTILGKIGGMAISLLSISFALLSNPIFLVVAGIGLLAANWNKFSKALTDMGFGEQVTALEKDFARLANAIKNKDLGEIGKAAANIAVDIGWGIWKIFDMLMTKAGVPEWSDISKAMDNDIKKLKTAIDAGDIGSIGKALANIGVNLLWGAWKLLNWGMSNAGVPGWSDVNTAMTKDITALKTAIDKGDLGGIGLAAAQIGINLIWGAWNVLGKIMTALGVPGWETFRGQISADIVNLKTALATKNLGTILTAVGKLGIDFIWGLIKVAGKVVESGLDGLADFLRTKVGIQKDNNNTLDIGDINIIASGGLNFLNGMIEDAVKKLTEFNDFVRNNKEDWAKMDMSKLTPEQQSLHSEMTKLGTNIADLMSTGIRAAFNFGTILSEAIKNGVTSLTGNKNFGETAKGLSSYFDDLMVAVMLSSKGFGDKINTTFAKGLEGKTFNEKLKSGFSKVGTSLGNMAKSASAFSWNIGIGMEITKVFTDPGMDIGKEILKILAASGLAVATAAAGGGAFSGLVFTATLLILEKVIPDKSATQFKNDILVAQNKFASSYLTNQPLEQQIWALRDWSESIQMFKAKFSDKELKALGMYDFIEKWSTAIDKLRDNIDNSKKFSEQFNAQFSSKYIEEILSKSLYSVQYQNAKDIDGKNKAVLDSGDMKILSNYLEKISSENSKLYSVLDSKLSEAIRNQKLYLYLDYSSTEFKQLEKLLPKDATGYIPKFSTGAILDRNGMISGPGTGTSDSILAMVSNGEAIINAASTKKYRGLLAAINSGTLGNFSTGKLPHFDNGNIFDDSTRSMLNNTFNIMENFINGIGKSLVSIAEKILDLVIATLKPIETKLNEALAKDPALQKTLGFEKVDFTSILQGTKDNMKDAFKESTSLIEDMKEAVNRAKAQINSGSGSGSTDKQKTFWDSMMEASKSYWSYLTELSKKSTSDMLITSFSDSFKNVYPVITKFFDGFKIQDNKQNNGLLGAGAATAMPNIPKFDMLGGIMNTITGAFGTLAGIIGSVVAALGTFALALAVGKILEGVMKPLAPVFEKIGEPLKRLGMLIGQMLVPVFEWLIPVIEIVAKALAWLAAIIGDVVINPLIWCINAFIAAVNNVFGWAGVKIPEIKYVDTSSLKEFGDFSSNKASTSNPSQEPVEGMSNQAASNQSINITNNITNNGPIMRAEDIEWFVKILKQYSREHGGNAEVFGT